MIEHDPAAIGVNRPVDVPLVGDLRTIVPQLTEALKDAPRTPSPELARVDPKTMPTRLARTGGDGALRPVAGASRPPGRRGDQGLPR